MGTGPPRACWRSRGTGRRGRGNPLNRCYSHGRNGEKPLHRTVYLCKTWAIMYKYTVETAVFRGINSGIFQPTRTVFGVIGAVSGYREGPKSNRFFYKTEAFIAFSAAIFGSSETGFRSHKDGHFFAHDGHYDSNDHREHQKDRFRVVRKLPFSPPPSPRRAYRQKTEGRKALARGRKARNVYLYIFGKYFTIPVS